MIPTKQAHLQVVADSHPGMMGKNNEDQFSISAFHLSTTDLTPSVFAIIADGIGGHKAGEVASEIAVEMISKAAAQSDASQPTAIMQAAIIQASQAILAESKQEDEKKGMGTTCVCAWVIGNQLYTASVGNSRLYLVRGSKMFQLTVDHTWVQEAVEAGALTDKQARLHPHANIIRRYLGSPQPVEVDLRLRSDRSAVPSEKNQGMRLYPGDRLILCSDGLSDMVEDDVILQILRSDELDDVVPALIEEANQNGGKDNITVVALEVPNHRSWLRFPRIDFRDRKVQMALSYIGLGLIALIVLIASVIFGLRVLSTKPTPTPSPTSLAAPTAMIETSTP
jgi:protein phosphatase